MSAIQSDVQTEQQIAATVATPATPSEPALSERELAMEALQARHFDTLAKDNGHSEDDTPAPAPAPAPAVATGTEDQLAMQLGTTTAPASLPATVKVKVDGEDADVPFDDVVRQYQKNASADRRLEEATRLLRQAQEREAQLLLQQQHAAQQAAAQAAAAPQHIESTSAGTPVAESGKEFLKALFEGDEDNALAALEKVMAGRPVATHQVAQPTLDVDQITAAVAQQVQQRVAIDHLLDANQRDYPEMYADPDIENLAAQKIARLRNEQGMDFPSALTSVSQELAGKFGWGAARNDGRPAPEATHTVDTRAAKLAQKQTIDNIASVGTKTVTPEALPETHSSIIAQMKAQRSGG